MNGIIIQKDAVYKTEKGTPVTDSLKVAQVFGRQHKNVIRSIRDIMMSANLLANRQTFCESTYMDSQGRKQPIFLMTKEGFCALVMRWNGEKANQFKMAFIEMFSKMESAFQRIQPQYPAIPQTFAEALRLAASQAEQIEEQQRKIEADAPRVLFSQAVETSDKSVLIGELAKIICQNGVQTGEKGFSLGYVKTVTCVHTVNGITNRPKKRWNLGCLKSRKQPYRNRMVTRLFPIQRK